MYFCTLIQPAQQFLFENTLSGGCCKSVGPTCCHISAVYYWVMTEERDSANEKKEVEDYLKQFCMEECLDEIMNEIVIERPTNPYVAMALLCESKTLPEIIDVSFKSVIVCGALAVQANFTTNISTFTGIATYKQSNSEEPVIMKDYSMLREKIRDAILEVDPVNLFKVDECVATLAGVDPAESLALSIACCRAGARHKGMKLYHYLAHTVGLKEEELCIPTPVVSVLSRIIEGQSTQDITVTSTKAGTFTGAMELILHTASLVAKDDTVTKPQTLSIWGSPCLNTANINEAAKVALLFCIVLAISLFHSDNSTLYPFASNTACTRHFTRQRSAPRLEAGCSCVLGDAAKAAVGSCRTQLSVPT